MPRGKPYLRSRSAARSIVVENRPNAPILLEQRITAIAKQVQVERLISLLLAVPLDFDRDGLRRLAGGEGQRAGPGDVVAAPTPRRGRAVHGAERQRHGLIVGGRERDREREHGRLVLLALGPGRVADADARLVVDDRALPRTIGKQCMMIASEAACA